MRYIYDCFDSNDKRYETFTRFEEVVQSHIANGNYIKVKDQLDNRIRIVLKTVDDLEGWQTKLERDYSWKPPRQAATKDNINPSHYQAYIKVNGQTELQWIEAMQYLPHYRDPKNFLAAVELQVRKYLDRSGGKDEELQETEKALWYLKFMTAYIKNNYSPIFIKDIDTILKR